MKSRFVFACLAKVFTAKSLGDAFALAARVLAYVCVPALREEFVPLQPD